MHVRLNFFDEHKHFTTQQYQPDRSPLAEGKQGDGGMPKLEQPCVDCECTHEAMIPITETFSEEGQRKKRQMKLFLVV